MKEIWDTKKLKDIPCSWNEELILFKNPYNLRSSTIECNSIKLPMTLFIELEYMILKYIWNNDDPKQSAKKKC